jgi:hypothetical protein
MTNQPEKRGWLIRHLEDALELADEIEDGKTGFLIERALDQAYVPVNLRQPGDAKRGGSSSTISTEVVSSRQRSMAVCVTDKQSNRPQNASPHRSKARDDGLRTRSARGYLPITIR